MASATIYTDKVSKTNATLAPPRGCRYVHLSWGPWGTNSGLLSSGKWTSNGLVYQHRSGFRTCDESLEMASILKWLPVLRSFMPLNVLKDSNPFIRVPTANNEGNMFC